MFECRKAHPQERSSYQADRVLFDNLLLALLSFFSRFSDQIEDAITLLEIRLLKIQPAFAEQPLASSNHIPQLERLGFQYQHVGSFSRRKLAFVLEL